MLSSESAGGPEPGVLGNRPCLVAKRLGASPARVTGLMLRYGLIPAICGIAAGWSGALAISRFFAALQFGVGPLDLPTWIVVSGCVLAVACVASYLPARRARRVDPVAALRAE